MPKARIKIISSNIDDVNLLCNQIKDIAEKSKVDFSGPIPLPVKKLKLTTRKSPWAKGSETYQNFEMRIHKRLIDLGLDDRALRMIMRIPIPHGLNVEIEMIND